MFEMILNFVTPIYTLSTFYAFSCSNKLFFDPNLSPNSTWKYLSLIQVENAATKFTFARDEISRMQF